MKEKNTGFLLKVEELLLEIIEIQLFINNFIEQ